MGGRELWPSAKTHNRVAVGNYLRTVTWALGRNPVGIHGWMSLSLLKSTVTSRKVFPPSPSPPHPSSAFAFALARRVISFSQFSSELRVYFILDCFVHANQRRPRAFEPCSRQFLGRVNSEFAAAGYFADGMVEHVGRGLADGSNAQIMPLLRTNERWETDWSSVNK